MNRGERTVIIITMSAPLWETFKCCHHRSSSPTPNMPIISLSRASLQFLKLLINDYQNCFLHQHVCTCECNDFFMVLNKVETVFVFLFHHVVVDVAVVAAKMISGDGGQTGLGSLTREVKDDSQRLQAFARLRRAPTLTTSLDYQP